MKHKHTKAGNPGELPGINPDEMDYQTKPRRMDVHGYEVGSHVKYFPGDKVKLKVEGHVHSIQHNGHVVVHIADVKEDKGNKPSERLRLMKIAHKMFKAKEGH